MRSFSETEIYMGLITLNVRATQGLFRPTEAILIVSEISEKAISGLKFGEK